MGEQKDDKPFFAYLAFTAPHDPLHVPDEWLDRNVGKYNDGYSNLRTKRLARMKELGIVPHETSLGLWMDQVPQWNSLTADHKRAWYCLSGRKRGQPSLGNITTSKRFALVTTKQPG